MLGVLFHERSEMKPEALKQMLLVLVATPDLAAELCPAAIASATLSAGCMTEMLLGDVAAECPISKSGLRYTFDLGRTGSWNACSATCAVAGNEEGIAFSFTC